MKYHADDRATRYLDVFPLKEGQVNISVIPPRSLVAWHKHRRQKDFWFVAKGFLKVGIVAPDGTHRFEYLSEREPRVLQIDEEHWHGYRTLAEETILVYFLTRAYDPDDEIRASLDELGVNWETPVR